MIAPSAADQAARAFPGSAQRSSVMMHDGYLWGMGVGHLVGVVLIVLVIAALVKYVFLR